jgi:anti-sigma factor RsiW
MIFKEKLHAGPLNRAALSRNNQAYLKDKSSAPQSLPGRPTASSAHLKRDPAIADRTEQAMTTTDTVRRHPDGSIDFDFYRASATALRRQAMQDGKVLRKMSGAMLTLACVIGVVTLIASTASRDIGVTTASAATPPTAATAR